jgi:hypothetical protein
MVAGRRHARACLPALGRRAGATSSSVQARRALFEGGGSWATSRSPAHSSSPYESGRRLDNNRVASSPFARNPVPGGSERPRDHVPSKRTVPPIDAPAMSLFCMRYCRGHRASPRSAPALARPARHDDALATEPARGKTSPCYCPRSGRGCPPWSRAQPLEGRRREISPTALRDGVRAFDQCRDGPLRTRRFRRRGCRTRHHGHGRRRGLGLVLRTREPADCCRGRRRRFGLVLRTR